ncbi:MAG: class I SAM-dependent methyltransferase [Saprospiraceae bacterium]|nr:class I SAM-dependent methyltransferase [Saprospiraceae bacterium]
MKTFWDERYQEKDYVYGAEPNLFFKECILQLPAGKLLLPAEGEGRNAVFAAQHGWSVTAFDQSESGKTKAMLLATQKSVEITYDVLDIVHMPYPAEKFDAAALIYVHFPDHVRQEYHRKIADKIKQGGSLILEAFCKNNLPYRTANPSVGGPDQLSMLFDLEELKQDFPGFLWEIALETEIYLNEGKYHQGKAMVVRLFGIKK